MTTLLIEIFRYLGDPLVLQQVIDGTCNPSTGTSLIVFNFLAVYILKKLVKGRKKLSLLVTKAENKEEWKSKSFFRRFLLQ